MKAERPRRLFRNGKLVAAIVAPLLALGAAVSAPAQDKQAVVQISDSELSRCRASPSDKFNSKQVCLRGRVRAVTTESRTARSLDGGLVEGALYFVGRETYDERGNRVKVDSWRTKPDAHLITESSYDTEGHEVGSKFSRLTPDGWQTSKSKKVTTVEGKLTSVRSYSTDGALRGRTDILKDERGNILSEELYRTDTRGEEQLQWKVTHRYDRSGFLKETVYHKAAASLGARAVYEYDEQGNCTSLTKYNADGTFAGSIQRAYEYDAVGNWVTYVSFNRPWENRAPEPRIIVRRQIAYY